MSIANELITRGWTQGKAEQNGAVCLGSAALRAYSGEQQRQRAFAALNTAARAHGFSSFVDANDRSSTTYDDALRIAKEADELLEAT